MYFPDGFAPKRAIQIAELVKQAYEQLTAFQQNREWNIHEKYSVIKELHYFGTEATARKINITQFDKELRQFAKTKSQQGQGLPIGFIVRQRAEVYLVFRGTMTTKEWLADFNFRLTPNPFMGKGKVHDGFLRTYQLFRQTIQDSLDGFRPGAQLFITGHSLGAGLATLAAADIASTTRFKAPIVYTYASPRVGDKQFAADYNELLTKRSFRVANTSDMVVSIPFPVPFLGLIGGYFTHVETPVEFTVQKEDVEENHDIGTYLEALKSCAKRRGLFGSIFK